MAYIPDYSKVPGLGGGLAQAIALQNQKSVAPSGPPAVSDPNWSAEMQKLEQPYLNSSQYGGVFKQAYGNLGQAAEEANTPQAVIAGGTDALAKTFIDEFHSKFNQIPTEAQVSDFVSQNLTPTFAQKFIQGTVPDIAASLVRPYLKDNAADFGNQQGGLDTNLQNLKDQTEQLYAQQRGALSDQANQLFGKSKIGLANDLAAQGLTRSPVSRYSLDELEGAKNNSLVQGLAGLSGQQASGNVNLANTLANLTQQNQQFNSDLGLRRQAFNNAVDQQTYQQGLARRQLDMASQLGIAQAGALPSKTSKALTGFASGAAGGATLGSVIPGLGTAVGAGVGGLAGGLAGYFG